MAHNPIEDANQFIGLVAGLTRDGECLAHPLLCTAGKAGPDCQTFTLTAEDARETLHNLIGKARELRFAAAYWSNH